VAHEINNPLAYVLLNLQAFTRHTESLGAAFAKLSERLCARLGEADARGLLAEAQLGDVEARLARVAQHGKDATEGAERVQRIVRDLMTFSRVTEEQQTLVDVNAAVEVALKMAHHEIKYRARLVRDLGQLAPVLGNDGRLSQVFLNLLINAARAIEEGHPDDNEIRVRTWLDDGQVSVEVADTGQGVAPEHLDRLFEPFFSTRAPGAGAGLGLSICHNVVRAHGGRIEVQSQLGVGTRFLVRLPASDAHRTSARAAPATGASTAARLCRILLIDDEPMALRVLGQLLGRTYEVATADGYASAIGMLEHDDRFDAVLCDMMMLDGTGVDVHAWVCEHRPALAARMIFITGGTFTPKARAFLSDVAAHHLVKPFSLRELDEVLVKLLRG
jgi:CheY-like chemotaxis protein